MASLTTPECPLRSETQHLAEVQLTLRDVATKADTAVSCHLNAEGGRAYKISGRNKTGGEVKVITDLQGRFGDVTAA